MNKQELYKAIEQGLSQGLVSKQELFDFLGHGQYSAINSPESIEPGVIDAIFGKKIGIVEILYYIGGLIVSIGIGVLIAQNWDIFNNLAKITVSLGAGLLIYIAGVIFSRREKLTGVAQAFFLIAALVIPIGSLITLDIAGLRLDFSVSQNIFFLLMTIFYLGSYFSLRKVIFLIFGIFFATGLFFTLTNSLFVTSTNEFFSEFIRYRILIVGLSYMGLAHWMAKGFQPVLARAFYVLGAIGLLGGALSLSGWSKYEGILWDVIFPGLVFALLFLSVYVKNKGLLLVGSSFLMVYILKITGVYFSEGLGWPVALMVAGFALIGVGYLTYTLNQKYFKRLLV